MVTFSCEVCNESLLKKKADQHSQRCRGAYFTCIDCSTTFQGNEYRNHTQCITEDQKYQKALYRPKKQLQQQKQIQSPQTKLKTKETNVEAKHEKKTIENENNKSRVSKVDLKNHKGKELYKVIKKLSKDEKKALLKSIKINEDGTLQVK